MPQHDLSIANQGFPAFRADLNDALGALGTNSSGATAPATTFANQFWYDTANNQLKQRNEDNDAWMVVAEYNQTTDTLIAIGGKTLPTGAIVGESDTQTLTNKTINASQLVDASITPAKLDSTAQYMGFKNRIINGAMMIDQRNAGASVTPGSGSSQYPVDRFLCYASQNTKYTAQQNAGSVTTPAGFRNYLGITSSSAYSVGAGDLFFLIQNIEGFNTADLMFGTSSASTVTVSFLVRSSLTGTFAGVLQNSAQNRNYPFSYTISAANTWEQKSVTIAGDTTGTWIGATNGIGMRLLFALGTGSTYSGTAGSWTSSEVYGVTGQQQVVGTSGATFYITGVQLEKGSTATSFDYRPYGTEDILCKRYFQRLSSPTQYTALAQGISTSGTSSSSYIKFMTTMRSAPTVSFNDLLITDNGSYALAVTAGTLTLQASNDSARISGTNTTGATSQRPATLVTNSSSSYLDFASEL